MIFAFSNRFLIEAAFLCNFLITTQLEFTRSKSTMETLEECVE